MYTRTILAVIVWLLMASGANAGNTVLYQVVNFDCQLCAKMEQEGATTELAKYAARRGVGYKVLPFGPVTAEPKVYPDGPVTLFYTLAKLNPAKSVDLASHFYRYYAEGDHQRGVQGKNALLDSISSIAGLNRDEINQAFKANLNESLAAWSRTARMIQKGTEFSASRSFQTPSYILLNDGQILGFSSWKGSVEDTSAAVKDMLKKGAK